MPAAEENSQRLLPPAPAERRPVRCHVRYGLRGLFQGTESLWPPLSFPLSHSTVATIFVCALYSANLCELSLAFGTFCFLELTLLTILGGDKQLNDISNNLLGTLINEFPCCPAAVTALGSCKPADGGALLTNSGCVQVKLLVNSSYIS